MKVFLRIVQEIQNAVYELRAHAAPIAKKIEYDVPYVCQFAKPEHAELSLKGALNPADDTHWRETGAASQERYAQWAFTMCGMASTAMALGYFKNENMRPALLAEEALRHGVYTEDSGGISSMRYKEFARWIRKYGGLC